MNLTSTTPRIELLLRPHQVLNLDNRRHRMAIECKNGMVWVTCAGEHRDYILRAGRSYVPKTKGSVVIQAIDEARVDIAENK
jgi:predicted nucleic acid-binding Zn finger protein